MTPEEVKTMLPCWGEADWCRDMRNCVCKQNIEAAIRAAYEDAAKIADKHFRQSQSVLDGGSMNWPTGSPSMGAWAYDADIAAAIRAKGEQKLDPHSS